MKFLKLILLLLLITNIAVKAQNSTTQTENKKEISIQLTPAGFISLPKGYWAYMNADYMDAWFGVIETLNGDFKIRFFDGIVESVFKWQEKNLKWKKELKTENYSISYALSDNGRIKQILAKISSANFSAVIKEDSDIEKFLEIISKYQIGKCENCFNSRTTKYMKKFFEKLKK